MKYFEAASVINAPPDVIWSILIDGATYPAWNSTVDRLEGRIAPGESVKLFVKLNPGRAFPLKVTEFTPAQRMTWAGGMPLGLFKGARTFQLTPDGNGATHFAMREEFTGPLLPLIWPSIPDMSPAFQQFASDLKRRAEAAA